jgi:hypothetical protein
MMLSTKGIRLYHVLAAWHLLMLDHSCRCAKPAMKLSMEWMLSVCNATCKRTSLL